MNMRVSRVMMRPKVIHAIETAEPGGAEAILVQVADSLGDSYEPVGLVMQEGWTSEELRKRKIPVTCLPLEKSFDYTWVSKAVSFIKKSHFFSN